MADRPTTTGDFVLAQLANAAYADGPTGLPLNFTPLAASALMLNASGGETFAAGIFHNQNAAALVATGALDGKTTIVLAFRGSDDRQDSINDLRNINADFPKFADLIAAVEAYALTSHLQVAVTGHSLGGSMAQLYMASRDDGDGVMHIADTFGSAGALLSAAPDARITNFETADDPAVFLGMNRGDIGAVLNTIPGLGDAVAGLAVQAFPGLTRQDALDSLPYLTQDYGNRGNTVQLPNADGTTNSLLNVFSLVAGLANADAAEHKPATYVQRVEGSLPHFATGAGQEPLFDRGFYLGGSPDVVRAGVDAQTHYDKFGWHEARDPNPLFSTSFYLGINADVRAAGVDPLLHYERSGWHEGRSPNAAFDVKYYEQTYSDVAAAGAEPLLHFELYGWREGRSPDAFFDTVFYLVNNPDVAAAGINPLIHFEQNGWREGRNPSAAFNTLSYLAHNPDVAAAHIDPLEHYLAAGLAEHRML